MKSGLRSGKLTKWKDERGFGFIQPADGGQDVFLHITELKNTTRRPQENDTIFYYFAVDSNGKAHACNAFILGARNQSISPPMSLSRNTKLNTITTSGFLIFKSVMLSILPLFGAVHFTWTTRNPLLLILYSAMSLVTYSLYAEDKSYAKQGKWRISEQTLHLCELAGGWLGGFIAQQRLRHKNQKKSYQAKFWAIVIIHYIVWLVWLCHFAVTPLALLPST